MATQIGVVKALVGEVTATAADGSIRTLQVGDRVYANEVITTGAAGAVEIEFADGSIMDLGRSSQALLDNEVFDPSAPIIAESDADVLDDVAAIQQALLEGADPTELAEATAAGAGVEGGNEGHEAVFVDYLSPEVTPDAGFDTVGVTNEFDQPEEDIIILPEEEEETVPLPQVSVSVDVEIDVDEPPTTQPPPEDGVPTPEHPVLVEGNAASVLEGSGGGTKTVTFIINLSEPFSEDVQVTYQLQPVSTNGAADNPDDWFDGVSPQTVTILAGSTSFSVDVQIVEDDIPEGNGVFEIVLISAENATINPDASSATVTIFDDDVTLVTDDVAGDETDGLVTLNGDLDPNFGPGDTGSIALTLTGGTWAGTVSGNGTSTITADDGSWSLTIDADGNYTFTQNQAFDHPDATNPDDPLTFGFTAVATDSTGNESDPVTFTVTVDDDGPIANDDGPVAVAEDTATDITVDVNDVAGADGVDFTDGTKVFVSNGGASNGSVVYNNNGTFTYTPDAGFEGADSFEYTITDGDGDTDTATVTVNVGADSKPLAVDDSATVDESDLATIGSGLNPEDGGDNFGTVATGNLLANDTVNSGADLATITSVEGATPDADGVITVDTAAGILVVYTADFDGHTAGDYEYTLQDPTADGVDDSETFDYVLTDGDSASTSTATLTVNILDDEPVANDDGPVAVAEDTATDITVDVNDVAGADGVDFTDGTKVFVSNGGASNGSVVYNNNGTFTYTPDAGFEGEDSFEYTITDGDGDTDTATVTVNVAADSEPDVTVSNAAVDETGGLDIVDGDLSVDFGNDTGDVELSATGATWDSNTNTLTATDGSWKVVNNQNGTYTFTQLAAMSHLGGEDASLDILITATATDVDNDVDAVNFTVTVYDDGPVVTDYDGVVNINDATPTLDVLDYDLGEDGLGSVSFSLTGSSVPLTSGGASVLTESVDLGDGREALVGYLESGANEGYQDSEDGVVFTIAPEAGDLDGDDGTYELTLSTDNVLDLPQSTVEVSFSGISAGGPTDSVDTTGGEITISVVPGNEGPDDVNASNGYVGINNNSMDDAEAIQYFFNTTLINDLQLDIFNTGGAGETVTWTTFNSADPGNTTDTGDITITGDGLSTPITAGYDFDTIQITVSGGSFKVGGVTYTDTGDPQDILMQFDYQGADSDGDAVNGSVDVTVSATTTTSITESVLQSHPDSQVDPS